MLTEIFYWILNMSILGAIMGCILLLLRNVKAIPRFAIYLLWVVPLIRLWIPAGIANKYSLMSILAKVATRTIIVSHKVGYFPGISMSNSIGAAESYFPIVFKTNLLDNIFSVAALIWVIVFVAAIITACLLYYFTKTEIRGSRHLRDNIYESDRISSPTVYGVFHPKIILPAGIQEGDISNILLHERIHIRRRDNLLRVVAIFTACLHWFNPLSWIFLKYFFEDMELACDSKALKGFDDGQKKAYALSLLNSAASKTFFASAFGGVKIKVRIEKILSYRKLTFLSLGGIIALISVIAFVLLTNAPVN